MTALASMWRDRIQDARDAGGFTLEDYNDVQDWETCAVGELAFLHSEDAHDLVMQDSYLSEVGTDFAIAVDADDYDRALSTLEALEAYFSEGGQ